MMQYNKERFSAYEEALCAYCREVLLPKSDFWDSYVDYAPDIEKYIYRGDYEEDDSIAGFVRWLFMPVTVVGENNAEEPKACADLGTEARFLAT